jgi:tRNA pseudouridine55 synthase
MGRRKKGRLIDGVLLLDKPLDFSSNGALQKVRWLLNARKAGHTGALDPKATGVLPICLGEATKFAKFLLESDKSYLTTAKLGEVRESGDSEGELVETRPVPEFSNVALEEVLDHFRGDTLQVPTMYSALKYQGRPLYEWARKGITVEREPRPISVYSLKLLGHTADTLSLSVACSKGTYIRSLVEDIGQALGCGAHVASLRRDKAGHFDLENCVSLAELSDLEGDLANLDAFWLPVDALLPEMPKITTNISQTRSLLQGQAVRIPAVENSGLYRVYVPEEAIAKIYGEIANITKPSALGEDWYFAGVAEVDGQGEVKPKRLVNFVSKDEESN